jgi:hypothetical protein
MIASSGLTIGILIAQQSQFLGWAGPFVNNCSLIVGRSWAEIPIFGAMWPGARSGDCVVPSGTVVIEWSGQLDDCSVRESR